MDAKKNELLARDIEATKNTIKSLEKDLEGFLEKDELKANSPDFTKGLFFMLTHHKKHLSLLEKQQ